MSLKKYLVFNMMMASVFWTGGQGQAYGQMLTGYQKAVTGEGVQAAQQQDSDSARGIISYSGAGQPAYDMSVTMYGPDGNERGSIPSLEPVIKKADTRNDPVLTTPGPVTAQMYRQQITEADRVYYTALHKQDGAAQAPVDFEADHLSYDDENRIIHADGNVQIKQAGRVLRADHVIYNQAQDRVIARSNVVFIDIAGDVHFADEFELFDQMKQGFVNGLQTYMADGSRIRALRGERKSETLLTMYDASYTPCDCSDDESKPPAWRIRAGEVTLDETANRVSYKNARFEFWGVPVAYTPYFAHAYEKAERESGFLVPQLGYNSKLGLIATQQYYHDIAPNKDMTVGVMLTSRETPVALAEYRHRFNDAAIALRGSLTYSNRNDSENGRTVLTDEELRGHVAAQGRWDINEKWRSGFNVALTTDEQYLREYDFNEDKEDVLENEIYVERFSGRNYGVARLLAFQDIRVDEKKGDQPNVLPEIETRFIGNPNAVLGGRWDAEIGALGVHRESGGQDVTRVSANLGWQGRHATDFGLVNTLDLSVRTDSYFVNDRDVAISGSGRSREGTDTRVLPQAHLVSSMPFVKNMESAQVMIEPIAAFTAAPDIDDVSSNIPNEDSQDVQLDASNLFERNRFPGRDRVEDRARITYGMRTGIYGHEGSHGDIFLGQSYRFHEDDNPFPKGSGLDRQKSDFVGQISAGYQGRYTANYRFQLNNNDLSSQRHEFDGYADFGRLALSARYLYTGALRGTEIDESREQLRLGSSFYLTDHWRSFGHILQDLGQDPGLREASLGVAYYGCCMSFSLAAKRSMTSDLSGEAGTDIMFRIGLKGLGEFGDGNDGSWRDSH